jgi:hypothetical protein
VSIPIDTITAAIAGLTMTGITIRDTSGMTDSIVTRDCPVLTPRPNQFVNFQPVIRDTYGLATVAKKTVTFELVYRFFHSSAGEGRGLYDQFADFMDKIFIINDALIAADALGGTIDMQLTGNPDFGVVTDGAGNEFWGADVTVLCTVFINN